MKKLFALALVVLGLAACQTDHSDLDVQFDGNATITLSIPADAVTRAGVSDSAASGLDNTDGETLRFILAIYDETGAEKIRETQYANENTLTANFPVRLVPGRKYTLVAWADMVDGVNAGDKHYNTEYLTNITLNGEWNAMDETRDAFTASKTIASYSSTEDLNMQLTRPFAKLRVIATDVADIARLGLKATHAKVAYTVPVATSYNAFEQKVAGTGSVNHEYEIAAYTANNNETTQVLYTDYIFANEEQGAVKFTLTTYEDAGYTKQIREVNFNTDIPVKRNMLTTLTGNVMTEGNNVSVEVNPVFPVEGGKHDITAISSYQDLLDAIGQGGEFIVLNDIVVNVGASTQSLAATRTGEAAAEESTEGSTPATTGKTTTINLNGFTITVNNNSATAAAAITIPAGDTLVIAGNGSIELTEGSTGAVFNNNEGEVIIAGGEFEDNATDANANIFTKEENVTDYVKALKEAFATGTDYTLTADVTLSETLTLDADKSLVLNLNGKTISHVKECTGNYNMILNKGNLTITGNGKISFNDTGAGDPNFGWGSYTLRNEGTLVIENGTIEHLGKQNPGNGQPNVHMYCAIFQYSGTSTINGGTISTPTYRSARLWNGEMTINGGNFEGQLWLQAVSDNAKLTINGGRFAPRGNDGSSVFVSNSGKSVECAISGGYFEAKVGMSVPFACIIGGEFTTAAKEATAVELIPDNYSFTELENGNWTVKRTYEWNDDNTVLKIYGAAGLKYLADEVNTGADYFAGKTVVLSADIDLKGEEWTPIGSAYKDHGFMGNFNGNGFIIKNLAIKDINPDEDGYVYGGLFGVTEGVDTNNQNYIKNLIIENVDIDLDGHIVAAAIAYPYYTEIENVTVKGNISIKGGNYTSGVLAYTRRCVNAKNLSIAGNDGSVIEGDQTIGGVISDIQMNGGLTANYSNFKASGLTINGVKCVGGISGIIGRQTLDGATVENVTIVCDDVRKGQISGASDGDCCINNVTVNNIAGATFFVGSIYENGENNHTSVTINGVTYEYNNGWSVVPVAKIEETEYATLQEAFNVGGEITLLRNINITETVTLAEGKTVVLNLNGKTITATDYAIENYGTLTINGEGNVCGIVYTDSAETTINGGTYNALENGTYVFLNSKGTLTINGGTINGGSSYPIYSYNEGNKLVINNVTVNATFGCFNAYGTDGTVEINGGTYQMTGVKGKTSHIAFFSQNITATINGGTFQKTGDINMSGTGGGGICTYGGATLTINGGDFAGDHADVYDWGGPISIKGGTYKFEPNKAFLAEGKTATQNADGSWEVK